VAEKSVEWPGTAVPGQAVVEPGAAKPSARVTLKSERLRANSKLLGRSAKMGEM